MSQFLILTVYWFALCFNCLRRVCYDGKDLDKWTKSPKNIYWMRWPCPASYSQKLVNFPFHLTENIQVKNELSCFSYGEITKGQISKRMPKPLVCLLNTTLFTNAGTQMYHLHIWLFRYLHAKAQDSCHLTRKKTKIKNYPHTLTALCNYLFLSAWYLPKYTIRKVLSLLQLSSRYRREGRKKRRRAEVAVCR